MPSAALNGGFPALILAAGSSGRMGRDKASLPWLGSQPLLLWMVYALERSGWHPIVVLGEENHTLWTGLLPEAMICINRISSSGKTTSLAAGARMLPAGVGHFLVTAVDQPRPSALYEMLRHAACEHREDVIVPDNAGHRGHPVVLKGKLRDSVLHAEETTLGLRGILDAHVESTLRLSCPVEWLRWDCNTPEAYREALAWFSNVEAQGDL